jgi:hypothetical protein
VGAHRDAPKMKRRPGRFSDRSSGGPAVRSRGSGAWSLSRQQLRHEGRELGAGKVVVGHGLGLATFYRAGRGGS